MHRRPLTNPRVVTGSPLLQLHVKIAGSNQHASRLHQIPVPGFPNLHLAFPVQPVGKTFCEHRRHVLDDHRSGSLRRELRQKTLQNPGSAGRCTDRNDLVGSVNESGRHLDLTGGPVRCRTVQKTIESCRRCRTDRLDHLPGEILCRIGRPRLADHIDRTQAECHQGILTVPGSE